MVEPSLDGKVIPLKEVSSAAQFIEISVHLPRNPLGSPKLPLPGRFIHRSPHKVGNISEIHFRGILYDERSHHRRPANGFRPPDIAPHPPFEDFKRFARKTIGIHGEVVRLVKTCLLLSISVWVKHAFAKAVLLSASHSLTASQRIAASSKVP